jgi:hypothetical protein
MFRFVGFDVPAPNIVSAPVRVSHEQRETCLHAWAARLRAIEREQPIDVGEFQTKNSLDICFK